MSQDIERLPGTIGISDAATDWTNIGLFRPSVPWRTLAAASPEYGP
jgi:hypothetical protein